MSVSKEPLSIRNNNPGNLRFANQPGATQGEGGFARFETPQAGLSAMQRQIELDTQERGLTLSKFINKYAPPSENKTTNYIDFVAKKTGLDPNAPVPAERIGDVQRAMIEMEGGPRSLGHFMQVSASRPTTPPSATQTARTPAPGPRPTVQVASSGAMPASYTAALAANYLGDTEKESVTDQAMRLLEEIQSEDGGAGAAGPRTKIASILAPQEAGADPFALMAQAQQTNVEKRRPVPRMPVRMKDGGEVEKVSDADVSAYLKQNPLMTDKMIASMMQHFGVSQDQISRVTGVSMPEVERRYREATTTVARPTVEGIGALWNKMHEERFGSPVNLATAGQENFSRQVTDLQAEAARQQAEWDKQYGAAKEAVPTWGQVYNAWAPLHEKQFGKMIDRPWNADVDAQMQKTALDQQYIQAVQDYNAKHGTSYAPEQSVLGINAQPNVFYKMPEKDDNGLKTLIGLAGTAAGMYYFPGMDFGNMATRAMITAGTEGVKRLFNEGGEVVYRQSGSPEQGEVANPADIAEQMTVGTLPEGQKPAGQVFRGIGRDVVRGAQYLPYDLIGAPVDIATMAMRPFGYNVEKPVGGSEYLIEKAAQAGIANRPTGSAAETTTRIGMGFVNPAAVARQIPKGIAAVERGAETLGTGAVRAITGKPDITPEQIYQAVGDTKGIMQLGAPAIVKPKGGTFVSGESSNFDQALDAMGDSLKGRRRDYGYIQGGEEDIKKIDEVDNFFKSKFKNYYQKKLGSQNDPLREAFIRGDFNGSDWFNAEEIAGLREIINDPKTVGSVARKQALDELNRKYDAWTDITAIFPTEELKKAGGWLEASGEYQKRMIGRLQEQGTKVGQKDLAFSIEDRPLEDIDPRAINAFKENDLPYDISSLATLSDRMVSIRDYLMTLNPNQIKNITFEDAIIGAERYHEALKNPAKKFTPAQLFEGREKLFQPSEKYQWSEIKTEDALRREGDVMNHCIGGDDYCRQLTSGIGKHFSLQDAETGIPHTTISIYRSPFAPPNAKHVVIEQIKGNSNSAPTKYFNEIEKFLEDYEKRVGKIYITEDRGHIPPAFKGPEYTELPRGYNGVVDFAKGGMVDKPLYDRAA